MLHELDLEDCPRTRKKPSKAEIVVQYQQRRPGRKGGPTKEQRLLLIVRCPVYHIFEQLFHLHMISFGDCYVRMMINYQAWSKLHWRHRRHKAVLSEEYRSKEDKPRLEVPEVSLVEGERLFIEDARDD